MDEYYLHIKQVAHLDTVYPGFCSMKQLGVFLPHPLPDGMLVHRSIAPSIKFAGACLYTWVERGTVRVKCPAQEHNAVSLARTPNWTAQPRDECTDHEATMSLTQDRYTHVK